MESSENFDTAVLKASNLGLPTSCVELDGLLPDERFSIFIAGGGGGRTTPALRSILAFVLVRAGAFGILRGDGGACFSFDFNFIACNICKSSGCVMLCKAVISSLYSLISIFVHITPPSTEALNIAALSYARAASSSLKKKPK